MDSFSLATLKYRKIAEIKLNPLEICECMFFYDFFYSEINSVYYFYWKINTFTFAQICGGFLIILYKFFLLLITSSISLSYKAKINLVVLFRYKNTENQYMSHKKYGVHLGLSGPFDLVC